jgi:hypothetical protein
MVSAKEEVASLLERLPDDCSLEDVRYHLHVLAKVRRGSRAPRARERSSRKRRRRG